MLFLDVYNILQNIPFYIATLRIHVLKAAIPPRTVFEIDVQVWLPYTTDLYTYRYRQLQLKKTTKIGQLSPNFKIAINMT